MSDYLIETKQLTKTYGDQAAVKDVNLHVKKGRIYGLLGRNGAGKTTIMKMILGLTSITSGEVDVFGQNIKCHEKRIYPRIGAIIETPGFYPNLTGTENLEIFARLRGTAAPNAVKNALKVVGLPYKDRFYLSDAGWYMTMVQPWATMFVLPAIVAMLGSYMICREEQDDTLKSLLLIPVNETTLTAAKMIVTFAISILIYLLLFAITFSVELVLHHTDLSVGMVLSFFKSYLLEGIGVFLAVSPIIALVSYTKKSYWLALLLAEIYSFAGLFMSMSSLTKTFYPITALLGVAGYYETTTTNLFESLFVLLLCGCLAALILVCHQRNGKEKKYHGK